MKILHVLPSLAPGGMERLVLQLAQDAAVHGDDVVIASGPGAWVERATAAGAVYVGLPPTSRAAAFGMAMAAARLTRCIRQLRPDVVHSHNVRATVLARLALQGAHHRAALMPTLHGVSPGDYGTASRLLRRAAQRVIACSPSVARSLEAAGFPREKIDIVMNGAALCPAGPARQAKLRRSLLLSREPLVLGIGRLVEQKNWPMFIEAACCLPGPCFAVAGEGPLKQQLVDMARRSENPVRFFGAVDDIAALIGLASCVVFTSSWEGLPLALLEALSLGAPVVATAVDGVTDVVPAEAAVLVPPKDTAAVSAAIARILADEDFAADLRREALAAAPAWEPGRMLSQYRAAYQAAAARQPRWIEQRQFPG